MGVFYSVSEEIQNPKNRHNNKFQPSKELVGEVGGRRIVSYIFLERVSGHDHFFVLLISSFLVEYNP
jgi:hypothetical protein